MPWWNKKDEELPEELRDMKPEDLVAAVKASKKVETLEAELAERPKQAALDELNATLEEAKNRLASIEEGRGDGRQERQVQATTSFLVDGDRAFAERAQPLVGMTLQLGAQSAKNEARRRLENNQRTQPGNIDAYLWDKFENEIEEMSKTIPAVSLTNPLTWLNCFHTAKGRHADAIAQHRAEGKGEYFIETGGAGGGRPADRPEEPAALSEKEKKIAKGMGMTPEEYQKFKKEQVVYS